MRVISGLVLAGAVALCARPAAAATDCRLKLVTSIPLTLTQTGRALLPVTINGTAKTFALDTGGVATMITAAAAQELQLPYTQSNVKMLDMYGNASTSAVRVDSFMLGGLQDKNTTFPILTDIFSDSAAFVGLLSADYMAKYDVELDFAGGKMNYFSQDHCEGKVVYWPAAAGTVLPMRFWDHHLNLTVTLDGRPIRAIIDTGAPDTTLAARAAKQAFGLTEKSPGVRHLYEDRGAKAFSYQFQKLSLEGLEINNPQIAIIPDKVGTRDPNNNKITGSRLYRDDDPDASDPVMLLGMNILAKLRLYIAFSESKIYVTPASAPAAAAPAR